MSKSNIDLIDSKSNCSSHKYKLNPTPPPPLMVSKKSSAISTCRICLSSFNCPANLTCGHKFCEKCLQEYWKSKEKPDVIVCPLCRSCVAKVTFDAKDEEESTEDFRKTFALVAEEAGVSQNRNASIICLNISILIPTIYYAIKMFLRVVNYFSSRSGH